MQHIDITESAAKNMRTYSEIVPTETGGILVGTITVPIILSAGGPGRKSITNMNSFSSDQEHDFLMINQVREKFGQQVKYLGHWHKHPRQMPYPSQGDLCQARLILQELKRTGEKNPFLICAILQISNNPDDSIFPYILDDESSGFRKLNWSLISDDLDKVQEALQSEPRSLTAKDSSHPWVNPGFRFQNTPEGSKRLLIEKEAFERMGFVVTVKNRVIDDRIFFQVSNGDEVFLCIFPPEFPLGVPQLLPVALSKGITKDVRLGWNSDFHAADILTQVLEERNNTGISDAVEEFCGNTHMEKEKVIKISSQSEKYNSNRKRRIIEKIPLLMLILLIFHIFIYTKGKRLVS
jgi:integrative and conjugative element protein (TIGR02256 family)